MTTIKRDFGLNKRRCAIRICKLSLEEAFFEINRYFRAVFRMQDLRAGVRAKAFQGEQPEEKRAPGDGAVPASGDPDADHLPAVPRSQMRFRLSR